MQEWIEKMQNHSRFTFCKKVLYLLSFFFKLGVAFRHTLYKYKIISEDRATIAIISIGNIVCGGTGKTEFVSKFISDLGRNDLAILTRGYKSKRKASSRKVQDIDDGDEPFMLAQRCRKTAVIVGKKRLESANLAASMGCKGCVLDDGMQYLKLKKDLQVIMIRAKDPFSNGFVPFGMRRELLSKLKNADYIVIHGAENEENYELLKKELLSYSKAKCFGTKYCLEENRYFLGKKVGVFCGIGNPQLFIDGLESLGIVIVKKQILSDHKKVTDIVDFYKGSIALGAIEIVCTEKDYVKLNKEERTYVSPIKISMKIVYDPNVYQKLLNQTNSIIER